MKNYIHKIKNADLKNYCSFKIGGKAQCIYFPENMQQIKFLINKLNKLKKQYLILGNGTNILFSDKKLKKAIICLKKFNFLQHFNDILICSAGAGLGQVNAYCAKHNLSGLEFSFGIPASVGGAVAMNAGAFGGEICEHLIEIVVCKDGEIYSRQLLKYSYRKGVLNPGEVLLLVKFKLKPCKNQKIIEKQQQFLQKRIQTQPVGEFCAGSVYKRQGQIIPAKLIDEWGLKGLKIGGAQISTKHAGFIVNLANAKQSDVLTLMQIIEWVAAKRGYCFEREIIIV